MIVYILTKQNFLSHVYYKWLYKFLVYILPDNFLSCILLDSFIFFFFEHLLSCLSNAHFLFMLWASFSVQFGWNWRCNPRIWSHTAWLHMSKIMNLVGWTLVNEPTELNSILWPCNWIHTVNNLHYLCMLF